MRTPVARPDCMVFAICPFVRICYEHDNFESELTDFDASWDKCPRGNGMKRSILGVMRSQMKVRQDRK